MEGEITTLEQFASAMAGQDDAQGDDQSQGDDLQDQDVENDQTAGAESQNDDQGTDQTGDDDQTGTGEDDQAAAQSADDTVISWETASGEKFEVPVAELKSGYMRDQDYRHKTQQLSHERETFQKQADQQLGHIQSFANDYGELHATQRDIQQLESVIGQINQADDPVGYNTAVNNLLLLRQHAGQVAGRIQQFQAFKSHEAQQAVATAQQKAVEDLSGPNGIPGFGKELVQKWNKTGREYGFSDEELAMTTDPRYLRVLNDAMRFRELQAKKPAAVGKVKGAPQKPAKQSASAPASNYERDAKAFNAKPSVDTLAAMLGHQYAKAKKG